MKPRYLVFFLLAVCSIVTVSLLASHPPASSQTRERKVSTQDQTNSPNKPATEVVKVDVDLVTIDALVLQKKTARIVGGLKKDDFVVYEDGAKQEITHFSQDSLPLSVLLLIDRGGCLDPFSDKVHHAAARLSNA